MMGTGRDKERTERTGSGVGGVSERTTGISCLRAPSRAAEESLRDLLGTSQFAAIDYHHVFCATLRVDPRAPKRFLI